MEVPEILAESAGAVTIADGSVSTTGSGANGLFATGFGSSITMTNGSVAGSGISVAAGAALGGTGTISGDLTVSSGGSLLLDAAGPIAVGGDIAFGGDVTVRPASGSIPDGTYRLLTYGGGLSGSPAFTDSAPEGIDQTAAFSPRPGQ
jgi:fibronectin-binding autotransporter adhesin